MISVIVCSVDPNRFAAVKGMYERIFRGAQAQLIGIHDAGSLAEGYNRGIAMSTGEIIVLSHDDVELFGPDPVPRLMKHLSRFDLVGVAGTSKLIHPLWLSAGHPYIFGQIFHSEPAAKMSVDVFGAPFPAVSGVQGLDGVFMAGRRVVFERLPFDAQTFDGFHGYDVDFSYRAFGAGYRMGVANDLCLLHASVGNFRGDWQKYAQRFMMKHFPGKPLTKTEKVFWTSVRVNGRAQALEVMTPAYWELEDVEKEG